MRATPAVPRLLLLGTPQIHAGDAAHALPDSLPGYLVAYLAHRNDWVPREQLAALCWPEATEEEAQHNLRVNLNRLRPHLRTWGIESQLVAERRRLRLDVETDTQALRAAVGAGDWTGAAGLPRGPFMQGLTFRAFAQLGEWARAERDALLARWREAVLAAAPAGASVSGPADARSGTHGARLTPAASFALAERYLEHDPFDEDVVRVALQALVAQGRTDDALRAYERFRARAGAELGLLPGAALEAFARTMATPGGMAGTSPVVASSLAGEDALIGREDDLRSLADALSRHRVVVIVGLGGVGKTRLAREAVARARETFAAGVWWVDSSELSGAAQIPRRLADHAQLAAGGGADPVARLAERLADRTVLLVLDNAESLLGERDALLSLLRALLEACPSLRVLATSREPLGLSPGVDGSPGEHLQRLEGLALPTDAAKALEAPSVRLFVAHAQKARPAFDPRPSIADLAAIARATGGLPLALRLAANWVRLIRCDEIARELEQGLAALDAGDGRSVVAALRGSWGRLAPGERQALARLSVFAAQFDLDAARRVADAGLPVLASLVDRSLLHRSGDDDRTKFELHPLVRQYAREQLDADRSDSLATRERHALLLAQRVAGGSAASADLHQDAVARVGPVFADAVAAWSWSSSAGRADVLLQLASPLAHYFEAKGRFDEGIALFAAAEAQLDAGDAHERATLAAIGRGRGTLLYRKSDYDAAEAVLRTALALSQSIGHRAGIRSCLNVLGLALWMQGRYPEARAYVLQAREMAAEDGDARADAKLSATLAVLEKAQGDYAAAEAGYRRAFDLHRSQGDWDGVATASNNLGNLLRSQGKLDLALELLEEGLRLCDEHGFAAARSFLLINIALVHIEARRLDRAQSFAQLALDDARRAGERKIVAACHLVLAYLGVQAKDLAAAALHLGEAFVLTRALGDVQNQLESLDGFGRWLDARGERARALAVWVAIGRHPKLHGELKNEIANRLREFELDAATRERAERDADSIDFVVAVEQAIRELAVFRERAAG